MWMEEAWFEINNKYCRIACYKPPNVPQPSQPGLKDGKSDLHLNVGL